MNDSVAAAMAGGLLLSAAPLAAHHSFAAEWDSTRCREFTGTLTKIDWQNPHPYFYVDVKDADGKVHRTYSAYARGIDMMSVDYQYLDLVPKGRDEDRLEKQAVVLTVPASFDDVARNCGLLAEGFGVLGRPVLVPSSM
jgi:hypothetical protein